MFLNKNLILNLRFYLKLAFSNSSFFKRSYNFLIDYFFNIYCIVCDKQKRSFDFQTTKVIFNSIFSFNLVITLSYNFFVFNFDFDLFVSLVFIICNLKFNVEVLNNYVADINTITIWYNNPLKWVGKFFSPLLFENWFKAY